MAQKRTAASLKLLGGRLCLDFVNTVDWRGTDSPQEFLNTVDDLIIWSRHAGITTKAEAGHLLLLAGQAGSKAGQLLNRALRLREAIFRLFSATIAGHDPAEEDLSFFNKNLSLAMKELKITRTHDGYRWDNSGNKTQLAWILDPIIRSAVDILTTDAVKKVKACADPACGWLFIDISRNRSRRWCDMKDCGNRAKAGRFYRKKQRDVSRKIAKKSD